jgi:hypothetical protein
MHLAHDLVVELLHFAILAVQLRRAWGSAALGGTLMISAAVGCCPVRATVGP